MKRTAAFLLPLILGGFTPPPDFLAEQKKFERVRATISEKENIIAQKLNEKGLATANVNILMVAYKDDDDLEIYAKTKAGAVYEKLITYQICSRSGQLGPKREEGDYQVPEGFYHINHFNPASSFYLSLGLNYPNASDRKKSKAVNLGGSIYIHGACVTIGCLPMTTDKMKEIYLYALHARNNGQTKIPVYMFPFRMTDENFIRYKMTYRENEELVDFWSNLKNGYDTFMKEKKELKVTVDEKGNYLF